MSSEKILIVEDEGIIAEYLRRILTNYGYVVHEPISYGEKVLETAIQFQPDLILMDIMLSGSMNGIQAAAQIRAHMDIPVIYLSAYAEEALLIQAQATDPYAYLVKPVQDRELRAAIQVAFHKHALNQRLQESENKFRQVVESASEVFWLRSKETDSMIYVSPAFEKVFGMSCASLYEDSHAFMTVIHPDDRAAVIAGQRLLIENGTPFNQEYRIETPDGQQRWIWARGKPLFDEFGQVYRYAGAAEDITIRKTAEEALRKSYAELQLQYSRLALLRDIDQAITNGSSNPRQMIRTILESILTHTGIEYVVLWESARGERLLEVNYEIGNPPHKPDHGAAGWDEIYALRVFSSHRPLFSSNTLPDGDPEVDPSLIQSHPNSHAFAILPLNTGEECKGVLGLFKSDSALFQENEREFYQALSAQVAIAIDNAQMHSRVILSDMEANAAYEAIFQSYAQTLELRDKETKGHCDRVIDLTLRLAHEMNYPEEELQHLRRGAMLHDIGKLVISHAILKKPGALNEEEWKIMRNHPLYAYQMLAGIPVLLQPALDVLLHHHERWNGMGYPDGLKGEEIPLSARLFSVVDVWDALIEDRPYRPAWSTEKARAHLAEQAGKQFDPQMVALFLSKVITS